MRDPDDIRARIGELARIHRPTVSLRFAPDHDRFDPTRGVTAPVAAAVQSLLYIVDNETTPNRWNPLAYPSEDEHPQITMNRIANAISQAANATRFS